MKIARLMALGLLLSAGMTTFTGCSDDEEGTRVLLRPVTTMVTDMNHVQLSWKAVPGATEYVVEIYRVTDGVNELYDTITTSETSLTLDLEWDDSYQIKVRGIGDGRESATWGTDVITLVFPTILGQTKSIDTQARVTWTPTDEFAITTLTAVPLDKKGNEAGEAKTYEVSSEEYTAGEKILTDLTPSTSYKISAYSGEAILDNYRGRVMLSTEAADNFADFGTNQINVPADENYFNTVDWDNLPEGTVFILPEGQTYLIGSPEAINLSHSVAFVSPMTLGDYPTFRMEGAFNLPEGSNVSKINFKRINIKATSELADQTSNSLSGKQVVCPDKACQIDSIIFTDCSLENFRALVRTKNADAKINSINFRECTMNGIGNQGMVASQKGYLGDVTFDECTATNICGIADMDKSEYGKSLTVKNCTFCYAPMENSYLTRLANTVTATFENCVFGASMKIDGKKPAFDQPGTGGTGDYRGTINATYTNCYATSDLNLKNALGWTGTNLDTNTMYQDPANHNFKLSSSFTGCQTAGASKWRVM